MNYKVLKKLQKEVTEMKKADEVGTFEDFSSIEFSIFHSRRKKVDKEDSFLFQVPSRRLDNNEIVSWRMLSYNELNEIGVPISELEYIVDLGIRKNKIIDLKKKLISIKEKNNTLTKVKKYYIGDNKREYSDARTIILDLKKQRVLLPYILRETETFNTLRLIKKKKFLVNKVNFVFFQKRNHKYMQPYFYEVPLHKNTPLLDLNYAYIKHPVKLLNRD